jgi:hypothetical protein
MYTVQYSCTIEQAFLITLAELIGSPEIHSFLLYSYRQVYEAVRVEGNPGLTTDYALLGCGCFFMSLIASLLHITEPAAIHTAGPGSKENVAREFILLFKVVPAEYSGMRMPGVTHSAGCIRYFTYCIIEKESGFA